MENEKRLEDANLTDFEWQCLAALVADYGAAHIKESVDNIAAQLALDAEDATERVT